MSVNPVDSQIWGPLFGTDELRQIFSDRAQIRFMLEVEAALAHAQAGLGLIPPAAADAIRAAVRVENLSLDAIAASTRRVGYPVVGLVKELGRAAGAEAAGYIHLGATTQDIMDTALVMQTREAVRIIRRDLVELTRSLAATAARHRDTPMAARTHLQQAVPTTFGLKCATWAAPLADHVERLDQASRRAMVVQFGGAAGTLAALGSSGRAVAEALARELELGVADLAWHVIRGGLAETAAVMGLICGSLAKFALDIALLSQNEVAEVFEPYEEGRGASSTMPQKRNAISSEYIIAAARAVTALMPVMTAAMAQEHERAAGGWQSEALALPQSLALTAGAVAHARTIASGMRVDEERMRRNLELDGGLIMAESVAAALTPKLGREAAHTAVARASRVAIESRRALREVLPADSAIASALTPEAIDRALDPSAYLGAAGEMVDRVVARIARLA